MRFPLDLLKDLDLLRRKYFDAAVRTSISAPEFNRQCLQAEADAKAAGKDDKQAREVVDALVTAKRQEVELVCQKHLTASLGKLEKRSDQLARFSAGEPGTSADASSAASSGPESLSDTIIADEALHGTADVSIAQKDTTPPSSES